MAAHLRYRNCSREKIWFTILDSFMYRTRTRVAWELIRVEKEEFEWEFSQLTYPGQTRTRINLEFARRELSYISCRNQTKTRIARELTCERLHKSLLYPTVLVKQEQEWHESWEARVCMRVFSCPGRRRKSYMHENLYVSFLKFIIPLSQQD